MCRLQNVVGLHADRNVRNAALCYVSTGYYISPLIYINSASCFLPHVRSSDLLIFASSPTAVPPLDAVQFGKMLLPSVRPSVRPLDVATFSSQVTGHCINSPLFCFVSV